jgi:hypothetical protein
VQTSERLRDVCGSRLCCCLYIIFFFSPVSDGGVSLLGHIDGSFSCMEKALGCTRHKICSKTLFGATRSAQKHYIAPQDLLKNII